MERVAVDPESWARLTVSAADLPRTVQASLATLGLLMTSSGSVRNAIAHLVCLTARSRSTISEHLGAAQAAGWLTCLERGGNRANGATASVYQATVPAEVWRRREELLGVFEQEHDQADLPVFPVGFPIPGQEHHGPMSEFSAVKINPSILQQETTSASPSAQGVEPDTDPVIAAVIEELAALTGQLVSPAWAARCVSQIVRHRRVRHPVAYVVKTLQNAAQDATLAERFLPATAHRPPSCSEPAAPAEHEKTPLATRASPTAPPQEAPWEASTLPSFSAWGERDRASAPATKVGRKWDHPEERETGPAEGLQGLASEIYRPKGRTLAGLGPRGAMELARLRQQFAERHQLRSQTPVG